MVDQAIVEAAQDWGGAVLPDRQAGVGVDAADLGLDGLEIADLRVISISLRTVWAQQ